MKKLYRKGTVHPSPPIISDHLSFLPATILTLTVALSPEDREVLAYLISCSCSSSTSTAIAAAGTATPFPNLSGNPRRTTHKNNNNNNNAAAVTNIPKDTVDGDHPPLFHCSCFRCYMSYWVRWGSSPNHQLIHEIIEAFEDWLAQTSKGGNKNGNGRKDKRNKRGSNKQSGELKRSELMMSMASSNESGDSESVGESSGGGSNNNNNGGGDEVGRGGDGVEDEEKGSVRKLVSFIGERIWGAWGQ